MPKFKIYSIIIVFLFVLNVLNYTQAYSISGNFTNTENSSIPFTEYSGRLLLVDATTTWCLGCDIQLKYFNQIFDIELDIDILTLSVGSTDTVSSIVSLQGRFNSPWEFGLDENRDFNTAYNVSSLPTVFLFSEDGTIVKRWEGITPPEYILDEIGAYNSTMRDKIDEYIGIDSNRSPSDLIELILKSPIIWGILISISISSVYFKFIHNKKFSKILS